MMLGPGDLVLCAGTLPRASFAERVEAAAEAGFAGISLFVADYQRARADGLSDAEMRALLADRGVVVAELDPLMGWLPESAAAGAVNEQGAAFLQHPERDFYALAEALGARSLNAVSIAPPPLDADAVAEAFAGLCDRAAEHGLLVHLEFLPWTQIPDVDAALEIVQLAGRPNGGLMLDSWHHFRSGGDAVSLRRVPGERILAIQINDAPRLAEPDPIEETTRRRLLPGEGDIDLAELLKAVRERGSTAPIGVEVFSDALARLPAREAARLAGDAARAVLRQVRG